MSQLDVHHLGEVADRAVVQAVFVGALVGVEQVYEGDVLLLFVYHGEVVVDLK